MRKVISIIVLLAIVVMSCGCEAFVRKFTRKPKKDQMQKEEMVLAPEEYKGPNMTKEELYRQYLLYWKSWQDELLTAMVNSGNHKKQVTCANEAVKNLQQLRQYLNDQKQVVLDKYLNQYADLSKVINADIYSRNIVMYRSTVERLRRNILRDLSYDKVKKDII